MTKPSEIDIRPCWQEKICIPVINSCKACPATDLWENDMFCFEMKQGFCTRVQEAIGKGGTLKACFTCDYFDKVKKLLPKGEAVDRFVTAKLT